MALHGSITVPGDKSISHRALMLAALCDGPVTISGLGDGQDNGATARVLKQLGVTFERAVDGTTIVHGVGLRGLKAPSNPLDCGNSGTTMRLMLGILAGQPFNAVLTGDESLSKRPMRRVLEPLRQMGMDVIEAREGTYPPLRVHGTTTPLPLSWQSPIASAQVKSAILIAGLFSQGKVEVTEPHQSRDHTERMLNYLGSPPQPKPIIVPGDISSAAFLWGAALLESESSVEVRDVGFNRTRTGFLSALEQMGVNPVVSNRREVNGEPVADVRVDHCGLSPVHLSGDDIVRAIDELPLLAVIASQAKGPSSFREASELRVKESDRISRTTALLRSFGVPVDEHADGWTIHGDPGRALHAGIVDATGDHRIAMCAHLMARIAPAGTQISGSEAMQSSFPGFLERLADLSQSRSV